MRTQSIHRRMAEDDWSLRHFDDSSAGVGAHMAQVNQHSKSVHFTYHFLKTETDFGGSVTSRCLWIFSPRCVKIWFCLVPMAKCMFWNFLLAGAVWIIRNRILCNIRFAKCGMNMFVMSELYMSWGKTFGMNIYQMYHGRYRISFAYIAEKLWPICKRMCIHNFLWQKTWNELIRDVDVNFIKFSTMYFLYCVVCQISAFSIKRLRKM